MNILAQLDSTAAWKDSLVAMVHRNEQLDEQLLEDLDTKDQGWVSAISDSKLVILNLLI